MEELKSWYSSKLKENRKQSRYIKFNFYMLVAILFFKSIIFSFITWVISDFDPEAFFIIELLKDESLGKLMALDLIILFGLGVFLLTSYSKERNKFSALIKNGDIKKIEEDRVSTLGSMVEDLKTKMNLKNTHITLWRSNSKTFLPSIEKIKNDVHLILPMNFFFLFQKDSKMCEALIAHEFGHLIQRDSQLWHFNFVFGKVVRKIVYPYAVVSLLLKIPSMLLGVASMVAGGVGSSAGFPIAAAIFAISRRGYLDSKKRRLVSEELADTAAIIYSDGKKLKEAFELYLIDSDTSIGVHPQKRERIKLIDEKLIKYA